MTGSQVWNEEKKLREILENITEIYFETSIDGKILYVSPSIEPITGFSRAETEGRSIYDFYENPDDRARYLQTIGKSGMVKDYLVNLKDHEQKRHYFLLNSRLVRDDEGNPEKLTGTLRDVTEAHNDQLALSESEMKHRLLLENAGVHIIYTDTAGSVILINRLAATFLETGPDELTGRNISEILPERLSGLLFEKIHHVILYETGSLTETEVVRNEHSYWFMINLQPVARRDGQINGVVIIMSDITGKKMAEREMHKLSLAIEQSTTLILITDARGIIEYVNPRYTEVTGYSFREVAGKSAWDFTINRDDALLYGELQTHLMSGRTWEGEIRDVTKDGTNIWLKIVMSPVTNNEGELAGIISVMEDITAAFEAKEKEKNIRENLQILNETALEILALPPGGNIYKLLGEQLHKICPECLFAFSSYDSRLNQMRIEYLCAGRQYLEKFVNITSKRILDLSLTLPADVHELLRKDKLLEIEDGLYGMFFKKIPRHLCKKAEKRLNLDRFYGRGIVNKNHLFGNVCIITLKGKPGIDPDLLNAFFTQASLGLERTLLESELRTARDSAEEMNRMKSAFLANMSHELRTPLNGILGFSELLIEHMDNDRFREMASVIQQSGMRLLETLNTILDFSTIEGKNVLLNYTCEDVEQIMNGLIRHFSSEAAKKGLSLDYRPGRSDLSCFVVKPILEKIVSQLLSNAIKFTNEGKIAIKTRRKEINGQPCLIIQVADTGTGIPHAEQSQIFEEFHQVSEGFSRKYEGTGLGLTICKKFTDMLHGQIGVDSSPGKGSTFTLRIPAYSRDPNEQSN